MAYIKQDDDEQQQKPQGGLLSGYVANQQAPTSFGKIAGPGATGSGPTATGHINFDSLYAANEDTARRDAKKFTDRAHQQVGQARSGLSGLQQQFQSQSKAGIGVAPNQHQQEWAKHGATGVQHGKVIRGAHYAPGGGQTRWAPVGGTKPVNSTTGGTPEIQGAFVSAGVPLIADAANKQIEEGNAVSEDQTNHVTESNEGLTSSDTRTSGGGTPDDPTDDTFYYTGNDPELEAAVRAGAAGQYTGPGSLADMEGYKGVLSDYGKADRTLEGLQDDAHLQALYDEESSGPYIEGGSRLDAALTGQAGRGEFAATRDAYKDIGSEVGKGLKDSVDYANESRRVAEGNATAFRGLLDEYEGRQSSEQEAEDKRQGATSIVDAQEKAEQSRAYQEFLKGNAGTETRNLLHGISKALSPSAHIAEALGWQAPVESLTNKLSPQGADNAGNRSPAWTPDDAEVWGSMSPSDWEYFNTLNTQQQREWIEQRKAELRGGK